MRTLRKLLLMLFVALAMSQAAHAEIVVAFYSHEFGSSFPHAFVTVKGTPEKGGAAIDTNYGFTAKSVSPAILMGPVAGRVEDVTPKYVASSNRQFSVKVSDTQYDALMGVVAKWQAIPGKSYSLNKRNCVHFVGEMAQALGLKVVFNPKLMRKPEGFLLSLIALNPWLKGS